ncbi:hypothetical protein Tco_0349525 [Tanacetum coccineum]
MAMRRNLLRTQMTLDGMSLFMVIHRSNGVLASIILDDNKGVSSEGPLITSIPKEGPSIARRSKEPIPKELLEWYGYDTEFEIIYPVQRSQFEVIFKSPIPIKGCVLGLANVETWDNIMKKYRMRTPERCADKSKEKIKV